VNGAVSCACNDGYIENTTKETIRCECPEGYFDVSGTCHQSCERAIALGQLVLGANEGCSNSSGDDGYPVGAQRVCVVYVSNTGPGSEGKSWDDATSTISSAIDRANALFAGGHERCELWVAAAYEDLTLSSYEFMSEYTVITEKPLKIIGGFEGNESYRQARDPRANPTVFSGRSANRIFTFSGRDSITISGIHFDSGQAPNAPNNHGGAIRITNGSNIVFEGCSFTNSATVAVNTFGGAVYISESSATFDDCHFSANSSRGNGGAIYATKTGATNRHVTIRNSSFTNNTTTLAGDCHGGAASINGYSTANASNVSIEDSAFENNQSRMAGALHLTASKVDVTSSQFSGNSATAGGGGAIYNSAVEITVSDSIFSDNAVAGTGGAIYQAGSAHMISNSQFIGNTAGTSGGAIYNTTSNSDLVHCTFRDNSALGGYGGAIYHANGTFSADKSEYFENTAGRRGGAAYIAMDDTTHGRPSIKESLFVANKANYYNEPNNGGGALFLFGDGNNRTCFDISDSQFISNRYDANNQAGQHHAGGGAIYYHSGGHCTMASTISRTVFAANYGGKTTNATYNYRGGGAIYLFATRNNLNNVYIVNSLFAGNSVEFGTVPASNAQNGGGAIYSFRNDARIMNCSFVGNYTNQMGGAVYSYYYYDDTDPLFPITTASYPYITNSLFWDNPGRYQIYTHDLTRLTNNIMNDPVVDGQGNLTLNPFVFGPLIELGQWSGSDFMYNPSTNMTALPATSATWQPGELVGLFVKPHLYKATQYYIAGNTVDRIYVWGDVSSQGIPLDATFGIYDYRLPSNSPAIDRANALPAAAAGAAPTDDLFGKPRVCGPAFHSDSPGCPDIGACEYIAPWEPVGQSCPTPVDSPRAGG
jgi:predicted outer membrane repeat protein